MNKTEKFFSTKLEESGFKEIPMNGRYNPAGKLYQLSNEYGEGFYWIHEEKDLYAIKIHDFFYYRDYFLDIHSMEWPESLNITYFESVSGEEIVPYRRLSTDFVKIFWAVNRLIVQSYIRTSQYVPLELKSFRSIMIHIYVKSMVMSTKTPMMLC